MKQLFLSLLMALLPLSVMADAVEINGIYYNLVSKTKTAEVTSNPSSYTGSITIPESVIYDGNVYTVESVGINAFSACTGLTSVVIPNSVTSIRDRAFLGCNGLTSLIIPYSVTNIGPSAFDGCYRLTSLTIPNGVTTINKFAFASCRGLTSLTIPNSVTSIGWSTFLGCSGLTSLTIPNSVTFIGDNAFEKCSKLATITIGSGVKKILDNAFKDCPEINDVYCHAENVPTTDSNVFEGSYIEYATLHVPTASINAYKQAEPWKNFKTIVGLDGTAPETQKCAKPSITYQNGQLKMACATDGVQFVTEITDSDIKKHYDATIQLTATYTVNVYATKTGYDNSDVATVMLCWIDQAPSITAGVVQVPAQAVLIQSEDGVITIDGVEDGTYIGVYSINGVLAGSTISHNGQAMINTNFQSGSAAVVKIGSKSVKVVIK